MVTEVAKIDSNVTGLRFATEVSIGVLPAAASQIWYEIEPNTYPEFGGEFRTVARNPINPRRSRRKGVLVDLDASGGFNHDLTQEGLEPLWEKVFLANKARKQRNAENIPGVADLVDVVATGYTVFAGDGAKYKVNDLIWAEGFPDAGNNGLKPVTGITVDVVEASGLTIDASIPTGASIRIVGHQFASGDLDIDKQASSLPTIDSAAKNMTELNLIPGEFIFVGGDDQGASGDAFNAAHNNGLVRVFAIEGTTSLRIDKSSGGADGVTEMLTEVGGTKTIRLFFGDIIRNESSLSAAFNRVSTHWERTLGDPNPIGSPGETQSEGLKGSVLDTCVINVPEADKVTVDFGFIAIDNEQRDGTTGEEPRSEDGAATVVTAPAGDVFNTSSDFSRIKMSVVPPTTGAGAESAPDPLFTYITEATFNLGNNASPNKAVSVLGAFDITVGTFEAGGSITAYFADINAIKAIRNNQDVTIDWFVVKTYSGRKAGILVDIPLLALGGGRLQVEQDEPVTLPLEIADGEYAPFLHSAILMEFWYLPSSADT